MVALTWLAEVVVWGSVAEEKVDGEDDDEGGCDLTLGEPRVSEAVVFTALLLLVLVVVVVVAGSSKEETLSPLPTPLVTSLDGAGVLGFSSVGLMISMECLVGGREIRFESIHII